jgi:hypothetical protein
MSVVTYPVASPATAPPIVFAEIYAVNDAIPRKMSAPSTLAELAHNVGIGVSELEEYEEDLFKELLAEQGINVTAKHRLLKKFLNAKEDMTRGWTIVEGACSFAGVNAPCGALASIDDGKKEAEKSGGRVGGFDVSRRDKGTCWPRERSPNELIHNIQRADGTTHHTLTRLFIAPGASLSLLKELENEYKVVYDQ